MDEPVPGYYNGGGTKDIGIFRPTSGLWAIMGITRAYFGGSTDETLPGDYNGDGIWEPGIFRPVSGLWAVRGVTRGYFGSSSDSPLPADYYGGGVDNIGIFRSLGGPGSHPSLLWRQQRYPGDQIKRASFRKG